MPQVTADRRMIESVVEEEIRKSFAASGTPVPAFRGDRQRADVVLLSLDSLCGVEITVELETRLGVALEENVFLKTVNGKPRRRTFDEIVRTIVRSKE